MSQPMHYNFELNHQMIGVINKHFGGVRDLHLAVDKLFVALNSCYDSSGGGDALQAERMKFDKMLQAALVVTDDIQRRASTKQDDMYAADMRGRARLA